ncbi:hypothetical protein [Shewanella xiamenensis]|uniref:hypothetical protein n=1 Tax=Shewanella xiamenensis TaxID=332186 RepID=UPI0005683344|nr:hypothetical protein [Shewanella xiamenensis]MDI5838356.1 hypothetical protein [Shewanella xiamenensis]MDI5842299.1 hypothetical protein [Shewanella xiamenensis]MDI5846253.1 hypothetical protein [Shewanella xiamenensis]MDI5850207.1 hypothetical protein [Shewanella xiamenensis]MDI5854156.1 hypothetical protein [Shewanella xiamenensis]
MPNLKMTLLENSISFFLESVSKAIQAESDEDKWKFAILLLVQAIETSLKERLRRTNEIFVYSNIDKPKHTVDLGLAIERLEKISKVNLKQPDVKCIRIASELRNQIVHFEFDLSIEQIKSNFVSLVGFYTSFCRDHLDSDIVSQLPTKLHSELLNLDSYIEELENRASERMVAEEIPDGEVWECPACKKYTFVIHDGTDTCYLCGHSEPVVECEQCQALEFEEDLEQVDFGNMKGWENYKALCKDCFSKLENENLYEECY